MTVAELIIKALEQEEVKFVFGVPGEETEALLFALEKSSILFVPTRHEQGAAFMADMYGRITGKAGVCLSTLGPGATNLMTGIADAFLDKAPLVAITAQADSERVHKESHQLLDIVNMFKSITKWNASINNPETVQEIVRKAFKLAQTEKPGPTHIEVPEDMAHEEVSDAILRPAKVRRPAPDYHAIQQAMELLRSSQAPVILAGNGAIRKRASKQLREFVKLSDIPVVSTFMGKGALDDRDSHSLHAIGMIGRDFPVCLMERSDLVITVGYDIGEYDPQNWNQGTEKKIIHIDFNESEVYESYQPSVEIIADISASLWAINAVMRAEKLSFHPTWFADLRKAQLADFNSYQLKNGGSFTVPGVLPMIRQLMDPGDILISDVGSHKMWIGRNYPTYEPNSVFISNGLATMGIALPGGLAAKLARPEKRVVAVMGDGGFLMNVQEIETAKRIGVGFPILIFNDNDYGLISWKQESHSGRSFGTNLTNPNYVELARAFSIKGYAPQNRDELQTVLSKVIQDQELCLVEIPVDPDVNQQLTKKLNKNFCQRFEFPLLTKERTDIESN
ncbi:MAG: acetolactate synthase large subunit [Candidatus Marinimicrobia bacterium]|nr:acetolactate synthase large subunit [Candidatus Neomarinimicrobiota bacterium]